MVVVLVVLVVEVVEVVVLVVLVVEIVVLVDVLVLVVEEVVVVTGRVVVATRVVEGVVVPVAEAPDAPVQAFGSLQSTGLPEVGGAVTMTAPVAASRLMA